MHFRRLMRGKSSTMLLIMIILQSFYVISIIPTAQGWVSWQYQTDGTVVSVGVSVDGNYTVAGTDSGNVLLFNSQGSLLWTRHFLVDVECVAIAWDGSRIVVGVHEYRSGSPDTYLYDNLGNVMWQRDLVKGSWPLDIAISPDAKYVVIGDTSKLAYFYDISGSLIWNYTANDWVGAVSTCLGGEYVAAGTSGNTLYFFNKSGSLLWSQVLEYDVDAVSISPEGQYVAAGCPTIDDVSLFFNNGSLLSSTQVYIGVNAVSLSASAERIAVAAYERVNVMDKTGNVIFERETDDSAEDIAITANGKFVAFGVGDYVYFQEALPASTTTCELSSSDIPFGGSITASGYISPPRTGAQVTLTYTRPDSSSVTRAATVSGSGAYNDTYTPDRLGAWTVKASWAGDEQYAGSESSSQSFTVGKSTITCNVLPSVIFLGGSLTVNGSINPPISGATVKLDYRLVFRDSTYNAEGFVNVTKTAITSASGSFADVFTPSDAGRWEVNASWVGNTEHTPSWTEPSFAVNPASQISLLSATPVTLYWHRQQWYCEYGKTVSQLMDMTSPTSSASATVAFDPDDYWYIGHGHYAFEGIHTGPLSERILIQAGLWNLSIWAAAREPNQHFEVSLCYWDENHQVNSIASWTTDYFNSTNPAIPTQFTYSFNLPAKSIPKGSCLGIIIYNCAYSDVEWFFDSTAHPSRLTVPPISAVVSYTLNIQTTAGGTTNPPPGSYTYDAGTSVTIQATANDGYRFDHWELDGVVLGSSDQCTLHMVTNQSLLAVFAQTYALTVSTIGSGTTNPSSGSYAYNAGTTASVQAFASTGYRFDHWELDGVSVGSTNPYAVLMNANHTLRAVFTQVTYSLTISTATGGTTSPAAGTYVLNAGTPQSVQATANAGYSFDHWELDGVSVGSANPYSVPMNANHALSAVFIQTYTLTISTTTGGSTNPVPGTSTLNSGASQSVLATPNAEYVFDHWELDGVSIGSSNPYSVVMNANHALRAFFRRITYSLIISMTAGGTANPSGSYVYDSGTSISVQATANANYRFDHWELDAVNVGSTSPYSVTMNANHTLRAFFTQITYTLTISATTGGTTNPAPGTSTLNSGVSQSVQATASTGYVFDHWVLDGANAGTTNLISVTMTSNRVLQAVFSQVTYTLTTSATAGGTTSPAPGTSTLNSGASQSVLATPGAGYKFDHWTLDGASAGATNPISVTMNTNHALQAVFSMVDSTSGNGNGNGNARTLTVSTTTGGTTSPAPGSSTINSGVSQSVLATATSGYVFDHWNLDGVNAGTANPISVTMNSDHALQAVFTPSTISLNIVGGTGGAANPNGAQTINIGQTFQFSATPDNGFTFDHWDLNGQNMGSSSSLTLTATATMDGQTLAALFTAISTTDNTQETSFPTEVIYAAVGVIAIMIIVAIVIVLKKRKNGTSKAKTPPPAKAEESKQSETVTLTSTNHIFISHVVEDAEIAAEIAQGLEKAGYSTWYYERDSVGGLSYLLQTMQAIEQSQAVLLLISPHSLSSNQVTKEVVRTHEAGKPFIPVLHGISHVEFQQRQPEWREAIGSATSVAIPKQGVSEILPRITNGLASLGVKKRGDFKQNLA